ncbi:hypothetical protein FG379_003550 [Cryptosporidium bovis]|uniref:uncharacterized protein n=1 Tax=Cryptosporidium bovis TaxID=310047 RepID=UPI00351A7CC2|nr:hypothetical protein FG379_003550 [Cryptosporidium bovis]
MEDNVVNSDVKQLLGDEQNSINYLRRANRIFEEISREIIIEKDENLKLFNEQEGLIQSINEVKSMQIQISNYLNYHGKKQEEAIMEMESNFNASMSEKKEAKEKKKDELNSLIKRNNDIEDEISKQKIILNDLLNENLIMNQSITGLEKKKKEWKLKLDEQKERHKQLSDLSDYLSERFKILNIEYNQLIQEKKELITSKENVETLIDKLKKEQEEKKSELCKINDEIKSELDSKREEYDQVNDEINKIKGEKDENEKNLQQLKEQINISENEINRIAKDITSNKELVLKLSEELDKKKAETNKYMRELLEYRNSKLKINDLNNEINEIKCKLEKIDIKNESDKKFDKLVELEHINKLNTQLKDELIAMSNNLEEDERNIINYAKDKMRINDNGSVNTNDIDQLIMYLQNSMNYDVNYGINETNAQAECERNEEYIDSNQLEEHITKLKQILDENNRQNISLKMKKGKLKRNKTTDTKVMETLLIRSLKLIEKLDGELENDQNSIQFEEQKNEYNVTKQTNKELETPDSGKISDTGRRVVISNRRLLTPRKVS